MFDFLQDHWSWFFFPVCSSWRNGCSVYSGKKNITNEDGFFGSVFESRNVDEKGTWTYLHNSDMSRIALN